VIDALGSPWLAYAALLLVTGYSRLRCGGWFAPAAFVGLVWSFFTGASLLVVDYPVPGRGLWMLVLLIIAIQLGGLVAHEIRPLSPALSPAGENTLESWIAPCRRYGLLCTVVASAGCMYFLFSSLEDFGLPLTWIGVLEVGAKWTLLRYADAVEPWSVRVLITWFHPAALLGGVLFVCSRKLRDHWIGVTTLLPAVLYGVLTGARAAILLGLTCWIGGYVAAQCVRNPGPLILFSARRITLLLLAAVSMVGMFGSIDAIRDAKWTQALTFELHGQRLSNYMFGSPAAFADWYAHAGTTELQWGARTFAGEFEMLRLKTRTVGAYSDMTNVVGTESTNVYTLFRGLIEDFGAMGAVLIVAGIGAVVEMSFAARLKNARSSLFCLSAFYAFFLFSPLVSLFSFNGATLAWIVAWFVLRRKPRPLLLPFVPPSPREAEVL